MRGMTQEGAPAIEVCGLERQFGKRDALRGVDLSVHAGQIHALLGPNGAGKTTLLRTLAGLTEPTAGTVRVAGIDASKGHARAARDRRLRPVERPIRLPAHLGRREPRVLRAAARDAQARRLRPSA